MIAVDSEANFVNEHTTNFSTQNRIEQSQKKKIFNDDEELDHLCVRRNFKKTSVLRLYASKPYL